MFFKFYINDISNSNFINMKKIFKVEILYNLYYYKCVFDSNCNIDENNLF